MATHMRFCMFGFLLLLLSLFWALKFYQSVSKIVLIIDFVVHYITVARCSEKP